MSTWKADYSSLLRCHRRLSKRMERKAIRSKNVSISLNRGLVSQLQSFVVKYCASLVRITEKQPIFQTQILSVLGLTRLYAAILKIYLCLMIVLVCLSSKRKGPMIGAWRCMPAPVILKHALNRMLQNSKYGDQSFIFLQKYFMKNT